MRDLTEAMLIEIENRSVRLACVTADYVDDVERADMNKAERQNARNLMGELSEAVAKDVASCCEHLRAKVTA